MAIQTRTDISSDSVAACQRVEVAQSCVYCGGEDLSPLYESVRDRLRYVDGAWAFLRCSACGSAVLSPFPNAAELAGFYPPIYSFTPKVDSTGRWRHLLARLEYRLIYQIMYAGDACRVLRHTLGKDVAGKLLLDVGCGRGHRLVEFQRRGCQVEGADFQPEVADFVKRELAIPTCCCRIEDLDRHFAPCSFDLVTAFYVLEHVRNVRQMLRSCYSLLKPGGWFAAAVPLVDSLQAVTFGSRWSQVTEAPRHISLPSQRGVHAAFEEAGFSPIKLVADSLFNRAAAVGLSVASSGTTLAVYGAPRGWQVFNRLLAVAAALLSVPGCVFESQIARRPGMVLVLGRKPTDVGEVA
jgi:SAM-dependent methyltransferase